MARKRIQTSLIAVVGLVVFCGTALADARNVIEFARYFPQRINVNTGLTFEPVLTEGGADATLEYRWFVNGEEVFHVISEHFPGTQLKRGDQLSVEITPVLSGGERLAPFVSQLLEVGNAKPVITSDPSSATTTNSFSYQVIATDPDGDDLTFRLEGAPDGMSINQTTGKIDWMFDAAESGNFNVTIVVEDGFGGQASQQFELNLSHVPELSR